MDLTHGDKLFICYEPNKVPVHGRYSFFGNDFGSVIGFRQYIDGYIFAVKLLNKQYISCETYRIDIHDSIVYPLCFNYRHIVELYIKYLYFKYSPTNTSDKETFIKRVGHKLTKAWTKTKPCVKLLLRKVKTPVDISLFDDFIDQIDTFDGDSFRMRYPIKRDLSPVHNGPLKLDIVGMHRKMISLFCLFDTLDAEIDNILIDNTCSEGFADKIITLYHVSKTSIALIVDKLERLAEKEECYPSNSTPKDGIIDLSDVNSSPDPYREDLINTVWGLPSRHAAMLALLAHTGGWIASGRIRLATINAEEHNKDFIKLLEIVFEECSSFISFDGKYNCDRMCYALFNNRAKLSLSWLKAAIAVIDYCMPGE
jgi:hypothetical protein